ncbi:MAG: DNA-binding protein [Leptotrichia hongkongensis]|nr:DNA-binding protein [Leptotrichia hongkongensis]
MLQNLQTMNDLTNFLNTLSYNDFKNIVEQYSEKNNVNFDSQMETLVTNSLEIKLHNLKVNCTCPKCKSSIIVKNGKRPNGIQEYKCKDCGTKFTKFTNTILEKTRWHWDIWIKVLEMTINNFSIKKMVNVLEKDYGCTNINEKTVWLWRMKLIHSIANLPQPKLTGNIQIDETFIRESQKGSRNLVSYIKGEERIARYGFNPSKYGIMGSEFATITTAIDNKGYSVCLVSCLGKLSSELFVDLFDEYLESPSYICTDSNSIYNKYCELNNIAHYVKPSNYDKILNEYDYFNKNNEDKEKLLLKLYNEDKIDKILNKGRLNYLEFKGLKSKNRLSLARVNELHNEIKKFINVNKTNVSTKYLNDYILFFNYIRNYKVRNGNYPSSKKDVEKIFIEILTQKVNYTINDINNKQLYLPKPTGKYMAMLKEETEKLKILTNNTFTFNDEDNVATFNKREILFNIPKYKLYELAKHYKIKKYKKLAKWCLASLLLKQSDIDNLLYKVILKDRIIKEK